ncbi:hypothetical protein DFH11DRAFT_1514277 [Phellopilus nigrolimitatus]|nr:hypothetical protein DFH11DRAFT_1514277 [Phellopilus nigrolimitatus]
MQNLLQSLSSQRLKLRVGDSDLKRLLSSVKEGRGHDVKLSDAFYDSLEGVLLDLRAVTLDNRDAEAFLKPVSKIDYPDYYEIIKEPMDLQTMLKKVKQKQYKSKAEFSDDLELIWSNCFIYNTGDNHPLRMCAKRLQEKAHRLLKNITDRRDRLDPPVPVELRTNGVIVNGHSRKHSMTPIPKARANSISTSALKKSAASTPTPPPPRRELFEDSPAFVRSAAGMSSFLELDCDLDNVDTSGAGPSRLPVIEKLRRIVEGSEEEEDVYGMETMNGDVGDKRKLAVNGDGRPRKRARTRLRAAEADPVDFWWEASTSSSLMANGLPTLTYTSSIACEQAHLPSPPQPAPAPARIRRRKKKRPPAKQQQQQGKSLLDLISNNIRTLKRVRGVNDKFLALNLNSEDGPGPGTIEPLEPEAAEVLTEVDALVDDRPWRSRGTDLEIGVEDANDCLSWMSTKILEHSGFQSTSRAALDVFTGVAAEYLFNVGRTLRYLCDKYSQQMTAEEIILHTLFEHGITHVRDLESYITDDVMRYGTRLTDMEKKLVNAYNEATSELVLDDDAFFGNDEEEEDGELVMGNFADAFGDDFLGLRELGIASELGLQSLTIPKKLLKGKNKQRNAEDSTKPKEPPLPYPPPPPFIPLESSNVDNQIGLLKNFYVQRFNEHAARTSSSLPPPFIKPPPRPLSPTTTLDLELNGQDVAAYQQEQAQNAVPVPNPAAPTLTLPDDPPPPARTKSGPLGQILHPSTSSSAKKKKKPKDGVHGPAGPGAGRPPGDDAYGGLLGPSGASVVQMDDAQQADRKASPQKADALMPPVVVASA